MGSTKIKLLISESGMSIAGFARKVGVPQPTLHRIANGEVSYDSMSVGNFMKIAHGLGLSAEELYYDEPHHVEDKREIDVVYNSTTRAGREALLACARGIACTYPLEDDHLLPTIGGGLPDLSVW